MRFVGDRLRIARTYKGFSQRDLADLVAASAAYLSRVENDEREPSDILVDALAETLGFDRGFFYKHVVDEFTEKECSFRKRARTPVKLKDRILAQGTLLGELVRELQRDVRFPILNVPRISDSWGRDAVEEAADRCRSYWRFGEGPIGNMVRVLERAGVVVVRLHDDSDNVDAFSRLAYGESSHPFVMLNDAKGSSSRARSDMAHELGHLVMHNGATTADEEADAQYFAGAFLLPEGSFGRHYKSYGVSPTWGDFIEMKKHWKVSIGMLVRRAFDLRLMTASEYRQRQKQLSAKRWHKHEPFEPEPEQPEILAHAIRTVFTKTQTSLTDLLGRLGWNAERFTQLTGIDAAQCDAAAVQPENVIPLDRARLAVI